MRTSLFPLLAAALAPLAPVPALTLEQATAEALVKNPRIEMAFRDWKAALARVPEAQAWEDPHLSYDNVAGRFVQVPDNAFTDQSLSVEQLLPVSGKNLSRARIAAAEALQSYEQMRRAELDVATGIQIAWFQLLAAGAQLRQNQNNAATIRQAARGAANQYRAGTGTEPGAIQFEMESSKLDEERLNLQLAQSEARTRLNVLLDRDPSTPLDLPDTPPPPADLSEQTLARRMLLARPEIRMAMDRVEAAQARVQLSRREWIPDPAVNATAERYNGADQAISQVGVGVSLSIPWVNPGKYRAAEAEAREGLAAAEAGLIHEKSDALGLLHDQMLRIETAHHHYELYRGRLHDQARQAFDAAQFGYSSGQTTFTDWLTAQRTLRDVESAAATMQADYQTARAELTAIVGTFFPPPAVAAVPRPQDRPISKNPRESRPAPRASPHLLQ